MTKWRVILGMTAGSAVGAVLVATPWMLCVYSAVHCVILDGPTRSFSISEVYVSEVVTFYLFVFGVWLLGIVIVGAPFWYLLHRSGRRSWPFAAGLGAIAVLAVGVPTRLYTYVAGTGWIFIYYAGLFEGLMSGRSSESERMLVAILLALFAGSIGALTGFAVWRVAYPSTQKALEVDRSAPKNRK